MCVWCFCNEDNDEIPCGRNLEVMVDDDDGGAGERSR